MITRRKLWTGVGAWVLVGSTGGGSVAQTSAIPEHGAGLVHLAQVTGLGGEGGEGGEAGINVEAAESDPLAYNIALQVIAAHFYAGLAAYQAGKREAGAQMFAHGQSEVYAEMSDVFKKLGVNDLGGKIEAAVKAATENKSIQEVRRRASTVQTAIAAASRKAPKSDQTPQSVKAQVVAELIDRSAAQYAVAQKDKVLESYLDGLGFAVAAREQLKPISNWLRKRDAAAHKKLVKGLEMAARAYPGPTPPPRNTVDVAAFLSAASAAKLAVSGLR